MKNLLPLAFCLLLPSLAPAQQAAPDPVAATPAIPAPAVDKTLPVRLRLETWEAPALEVARKLDEIVTAKDLANLREQCLNGAPGVALVLSSAITFSPSKVSAESITERIYPTEYEPPALPGTFSGPPDKKELLPANWREVVNDALQHTTPTSFETRNTGFTLEAEALPISELDKTWNLRIAVDDVRLVGSDHFGADTLKIEMPIFSSFRSTGELRMKEGEWQILSMMDPPRGLDGKPSDKRWVTLVRLDVPR